MRSSRTAVALSLGGVLIAVAAAPAQAQPPAQTGNCVSYFTTALGPAGVAGDVISGGAHDLAPFGRNAASAQAHAALGTCPYDPADFLP